MLKSLNPFCFLFIFFSQDKKLVVGQKKKLVLRTVVSNSGEPAYLPSINVTVGPPLTLMLPQSHDCKFFNADVRTSLVCSLSNPIKNSVTVRKYLQPLLFLMVKYFKINFIPVV